MSERILVCVAWTYANGLAHVGHVAGANLPADIFARYHRMKGNEVLMVSGSDMHGTPMTLKAEQEGKTPAKWRCTTTMNSLTPGSGWGLLLTFTRTPKRPIMPG